MEAGWGGEQARAWAAIGAVMRVRSRHGRAWRTGPSHRTKDLSEPSSHTRWARVPRCPRVWDPRRPRVDGLAHVDRGAVRLSGPRAPRAR